MTTNYPSAPPAYNQQHNQQYAVQQQQFPQQQYQPQQVAPAQQYPQQQAQAQVQPHGGFVYDAFDCCSDVSTCCHWFWCAGVCGCFLWSRNKNMLRNGKDEIDCDMETCLACVLSLHPACSCCRACVMMGVREELSQRRGHNTSSCGACMAMWCFSSCALEQEHRELKLMLGLTPPPAVIQAPAVQMMQVR